MATFTISESTFVIGAAETCAVSIDDVEMPAHAAEITWSKSESTLKRLSPLPELRINQRLVEQSATLAHGDEITLDDFRLEFHLLPRELDPDEALDLNQPWVPDVRPRVRPQAQVPRPEVMRDEVPSETGPGPRVRSVEPEPASEPDVADMEDRLDSSGPLRQEGRIPDTDRAPRDALAQRPRSPEPEIPPDLHTPPVRSSADEAAQMITPQIPEAPPPDDRLRPAADARTGHIGAPHDSEATMIVGREAGCRLALVAMGGPLSGQRFMLHKRETRIGRDPDHNDIVVRFDAQGGVDTSISRQHCHIVREGGEYSLRDPKSKSRTRHNGRALGVDEAVALAAGDTIEIQSARENTHFRVVREGEWNVAYSAWQEESSSATGSGRRWKLMVVGIVALLAFAALVYVWTIARA